MINNKYYIGIQELVICVMWKIIYVNLVIITMYTISPAIGETKQAYLDLFM